MKKNIFLFTPWCEQGLSYDAKAIESIALKNNLNCIITYHKKRKIIWPCKFEPLKNIHKIISENDFFFCFERIPTNYIKKIAAITNNLHLMVNFEYYEKEHYEYYKLFKNIYCKSMFAFNFLKKDGLSNIVYMPWILWNFPISNVKNIGEKIKVVFNGGTGGYKDRRNLESVINLFKDYQNNDVEITIKLTKDLRRWTKKVLRKNLNFIKSDSRIHLIQETMTRDEYIVFLNSFDINLCPSKYEGFGLTLLEGLHSRLASITIDQPPMNELVINNENGFCVSSYKIDVLRSQEIFDIDRISFYNLFHKLVNNRDEIMMMKNNTKKIIDINEKRFITFFNTEIK